MKSDCLTCSSDQGCNKCASDKVRLRKSTGADECVDSCPSGRYLESPTKCIECIENCSECNTIVTCEICTSNYYLHHPDTMPNLCLPVCPDEFYFVKDPRWECLRKINK